MRIAHKSSGGKKTPRKSSAALIIIKIMFLPGFLGYYCQECTGNLKTLMFQNFPPRARIFRRECAHHDFRRGCAHLGFRRGCARLSLSSAAPTDYISGNLRNILRNCFYISFLTIYEFWPTIFHRKNVPTH